ncbi:MAG: ATP-binding protein [Clostridia bacterium]|nr:ATP-binding protein [Clostridia bacterium]
MYLKKIAIKNIGPIEELYVDLPFKEDGIPKPIIFVGENGTGKTIFQSQIVDSFYEIGSVLFDDIGIQNGLKRNYYKISGGVNLRSGKDSGFSILQFVDYEKQVLEYFDKVGELQKEEFKNFILDFSLFPNDSKKYQKEISSIDIIKKEKLQKEWVSGVHFYQPAYRYEEPFWKNDSFVDNVKFEDNKRFSDKLGKEFEIISSSRENKTFLLDLVLDRFIQNKNLINITLWENILIILRKILKNDKYRLGIGPRGGYRISVMEDVNENTSKQILPTIDNLSLGESILLNFFINIIRHSGDNLKTLDQIQGIVVVDEIDVHLHTDLQNIVLPELIKLFPKIQFIITTHSPLFLLGMKTIFGDDGFEVRNMPKGDLITTERFSEFENAYKVFKNTKRFEDGIKQKVVSNNKPVVYVEGPTDVQYIKKAYELYEKSFEDFNIEIVGVKTDLGTKNSNNNALSSAEKFLSANLNLLKQKVILLNDPEESIKEKKYKDLLYVNKMPYFTNNILKRGIENLFEEGLINKAKGINTESFEYHVVGENKTNYKIVNGHKQKICDWICLNGKKEDFKNFQEIFNIIDKALKDNDANIEKS